MWLFFQQLSPNVNKPAKVMFRVFNSKIEYPKEKKKNVEISLEYDLYQNYIVNFEMNKSRSFCILLTLLAPEEGGGGTKCPDPFHIAITVFFQWETCFFITQLLFFWGQTVFNENKIYYFLPHPPPRGILKKRKNLKIGRRA